jgi:hypothetical protein
MTTTALVAAREMPLNYIYTLMTSQATIDARMKNGVTFFIFAKIIGYLHGKIFFYE